MAVLLILGALAGVLTWTVGPSTGLLLVARSGVLPRWWQATNRHGVQKNILLVQALIVTGLAGLYVVIPDVSAAFWMLSAMAAQIYLVVYGLMFAAALRLRRSQPSVRRGFVCPHLSFWARLGMLVSSLAFLLGFVPPEHYHTLSHTAYVAVLVTGLLVFALPPFLFFSHRQRRWQVLPPSEVTLAIAPYLDPL
jgi:amino acid transporter